ncbi:MAG: histone deacetylase [Candidatus Aenigmarchaeota archaeon]|nr:histone deacetylase [Candidatus Aenigmarchaeota archaeon]
MKIFYSPKCLEYGAIGHPENCFRVENTAKFLQEKGFSFTEPNPCAVDDLLLAHSEELVAKVKSGQFFDSDTPNYTGIYNTAILAAGSAINAMNSALHNKVAFSLMRPPGHHAGRNFLGGFCYFNNIAIAVAKALENKEMNKAAIIDFDNHHGNGTQDIFLNDKWHDKVLYISLHQSPCYPGTGLKNEKNCINFPMTSGTGGAEYLKDFHKAIEHVKRFNPDMIAVSAGFDSYKNDPLTALELDINTFKEIGKRIADLKKHVFAILEGGYSQELPECVWKFLDGVETSV